MTRLFSQFPCLYRAAALLALFAMLVPAGTMLVHHPAAMPMMMHGCAMGLHTAGHDGHGKQPAHKMPSCPICQGLHLLGGGFVPPAAIMLAALVSFAATAYQAFRYDFTVSRFVPPQARPRAPPVLV